MDPAIYTRTWKPEGEIQAGVVFVHGFVEHIDRYTNWFDRLCGQGLYIFAYDQFGFGRSVESWRDHGKCGGWKRQLADITKAITHVRSELGPDREIFLYGQSMGGGLVLKYGISGEEWAQLAGVIATAPLVELHKTTRPSNLLIKPAAFLSHYFPNTPFPAKPATHLMSHDPGVAQSIQNDPLCYAVGRLDGLRDMIIGGSKLPEAADKFTLPLLIVHGTADEVNSLEGSQKFFDRAASSDKELVPIEGGFHELHNELPQYSDKAFSAIVQFITRHVSSSN